MQVRLLYITPGYAETIEYAARTSTATDCRENSEEFVKKLVKKGHLSVGRHCNASFEIICSRACSHQLVRHTHLAYTQESQRYVKFINWQELNNDNIEDYFIIPPSIKEKDEINEFKVDCIDACYDYDYYVSKGIPKEDARYILPNACKTRLVVSGNFQAFYDFIKLRTDKAAQWEIREIAEEIRDILLQEAPAFFEPLVEEINSQKEYKAWKKEKGKCQ